MLLQAIFNQNMMKKKQVKLQLTHLTYVLFAFAVAIFSVAFPVHLDPQTPPILGPKMMASSNCTVDGRLRQLLQWVQLDHLWVPGFRVSPLEGFSPWKSIRKSETKNMCG